MAMVGANVGESKTLRERAKELYERAKTQLIIGGLIFLFLSIPVVHIVHVFGFLGGNFKEIIEVVNGALIIVLAAVAFELFLSERSDISAFAESAKTLIPKIDTIESQIASLTSQLPTMTSLAPKIDILGSQVSGLRAPLTILMPKAEELLRIPNKPEISEKLTHLLKHLDDVLFQPGIVRSDWEIDVTYITTNVRDQGEIREDLHWSYNLTNIGSETIQYPFTVLATSEQALRGKIKSFEIIDDQGITPLFMEKTPKVDTYQKVYSLSPFKSYRVDLLYEQVWPVNRDRPIIHNNFAPREISFGRNTLGIHYNGLIKLKGITVIYGSDTVTPVGSRYLLTSPMLRDQAIEMILEFESVANL